MFTIEKLEFDQVRYIERCSLAAHGEIIQTSFNNQAVVGMRTFYNDPTGGTEALMVIGGDESGLLTSLENMGNPPAVIVTGLVRLVATRIMPFNPLAKQPEVGNLLQQPEGAIYARSQVVLPGTITQPAYVCLRSGKPNAAGKTPLTGDYLQSLSFVSLQGISQSFELELLPEPVIVSAH